MWQARFITRLKSRTAGSGKAAIRLAAASASLNNSASGTTFQANPISSACWASNRSPKRISSRAFCKPTSLGSNVLTPPVTNTPRLSPEKAARAAGYNRQIAVDQPFQTAAHGPAMYGTDDHLLAQHHFARDFLDGLEIGPAVGLVSRILIELFQILAGAEGASGSAQDKDFDGRIGVSIAENRFELRQQVPAYGVQTLGTVERNGAYAAVDAACNRVGHGFPSRITRLVLPAVRGKLCGGTRLIRGDPKPASDRFHQRGGQY